MTCKDCIYEKMCESRYEREHCLSFKDKANFVEVVRCKDCKHRYQPTRCALWYAECNGKQYFIERGNEFYCPYGERSEE